MFSGIVEATASVVSVESSSQLLRIRIEKPSHFNDLKVGDSIALNGICLTLEEFDETQMQFALAAETLQVTGWTADALKGRRVNLERSLRLGDRIHGHLVAGHVDGVGRIFEKRQEGESWIYGVEFPRDLAPYLWKKGSLSLNGVSLTINEVESERLWVCLIPETLRQTNLSELEPGHPVNLEMDTLARALVHNAKLEGKAFWS